MLLATDFGFPDFSVCSRVCAAHGCTELVSLHRHCDECLRTAAIELAWQFEEHVRQHIPFDDEDSFRSAHAGCAQLFPIRWYMTNSSLGKISHAEAIILRCKADQACFLVARGGVAALSEMKSPTLPRVLADPEQGEAPVQALFSMLPVHAKPGVVNVGEDHPAGAGLITLMVGAISGAVVGMVALLAVVVGVMLW